MLASAWPPEAGPGLPRWNERSSHHKIKPRMQMHGTARFCLHRATPSMVNKKSGRQTAASNCSCHTLHTCCWPLRPVAPHAPTVSLSWLLQPTDGTRVDCCCLRCLTILANSWLLLPVVPHAVCVMFCRLLHLAHNARMQVFY